MQVYVWYSRATILGILSPWLWRLPIEYNIYCDESCHAENDHHQVMVLGGIWCPSHLVNQISLRIKKFKEKHGISKYAEIKWTKVSPSKEALYLDLIDYFFDTQNLNFRAIVISDKNKLNHKKYVQTHDDFYYKMYFNMLKQIISNEHNYNIFLDIKDTYSGKRARNLQNVICNNHYDFDRSIIQKIQIIRSHEVQLLQIADLFIGAISYLNRNLQNNQAKLSIISKIQERSLCTLTDTSLLGSRKINLFYWEADFHG